MVGVHLPSCGLHRAKGGEYSPHAHLQAQLDAEASHAQVQQGNSEVQPWAWRTVV